MTTRERRDHAVESLERLGWELQYAYSPGDRKGKRFVFSAPTGTTTVFLGRDLETAAIAAEAQARGVE